MVANGMRDRVEVLAAENVRLRELLKAWVRFEREPPSRDDLVRLADATKRALYRLGPGWADDDD